MHWTHCDHNIYLFLDTYHDCSGSSVTGHWTEAAYFFKYQLTFPSSTFLVLAHLYLFYFFFFLRRLTFQFGRDIFQSNSRDHIFTTPILVEIYAIQVKLIKIMLTDALRIIVNRVRLMCTLRAHINHLFLETF